ncbi:MAG TPA: hypothetical protein VM076_14295 [Gemmatimonadaceae bacterium]|nr:hypothetical protein [Gemmatimonadaceae bacterium]
MLAWAIAYAVILTVAVVVVRARREPTIVRGDWVFLVTSLFVLVAALVTAFRGERFSLGALVVTVLVLLAGWVVQSRWWVIGAPAPAVVATVDECASRICAPATHGGDESTISIPGGAVRLRIAAAGGSTMIVFVACSRHRKAALFRKLLAKQYRSVMPTIRVGGA